MGRLWAKGNPGVSIERHRKSGRKLLEKSFEQIYPDLRAKVLRYVNSRGGGLDCEDIADAVIERLWKRMCRTGAAVKQPEAMAITIAANLVKDARKKSRPVYTDKVAEIVAGFGLTTTATTEPAGSTCWRRSRRSICCSGSC